MKKMKKKSLLILSVLGSLFLSTNVNANRYYVKSNATGANNGTSWANAFTDIQSALVGTAADTIFVAAGTYKPSKDINGNTASRDATFKIINNKKIYGGFSGTETSLSQRNVIANATIFDGDIGTTGVSTDNAYHVVYLSNGTSGIELDGINIVNGTANGSGVQGQGAGIFAVATTGSIVAKIKNCVLANNTCSESGGAVRAGSSGNYTSNLEFTNCVFTKNNATSEGGAIRVLDVSTSSVIVKLNNCVVSENTAAYYDMSIDIQNLTGSTVEINNSTIYNNSSTSSGSSRGIFAWRGEVKITNSIVSSKVGVNTFLGSGSPSPKFTIVNSLTTAGVDPLFVNASNPIGADNVWRTADDGMNIAANSPARHTVNTLVDIGAYSFIESQSANVNANRYYVKSNATGANNGTSWANAFTDIQSALVGTAADTIFVAAGTYKPSKDINGNTASRDATFKIINNKKIYGGFSGTETSLSQRNVIANATIFDGDIGTTGVSTDNAYHVVYLSNGTSGIELDGINIVNGTANGSGVQGQGAGILAVATTGSIVAKIKNCVLMNNYSSDLGAGLYADSGPTSASSNLEFTNCVFSNNQSPQAGTGGSAAAIEFYVGSVKFNNSVFYGNGQCVIRTDRAASVEINSCTVYKNGASSNGGILLNGAGNINIKNSIIYGNGGYDLRKNASGMFITTTNIGPEGSTVNGTGSATATNPLFVNPANPIGADNIWRTADDGLQLQGASPAINAGASAGVLTYDDITNTPRIGNPDIGAYEQTSSATTNKLTITANKTEICNGETVQLTAIGASSCFWSVNGGIINQTATSSISVTPPSSASSPSTSIYSVVGKDVNGYSGQGSIAIKVNPKPTIVASVKNTISGNEGSVPFSVSGANTYVWETSEGVITQGLSSDGSFGNLMPLKTTTYTITGTDAKQCKNKTSVTITVNSAAASAVLPAATAPLYHPAEAMLSSTPAGSLVRMYSLNNGSITSLENGTLQTPEILLVNDDPNKTKSVRDELNKLKLMDASNAARLERLKTQRTLLEGKEAARNKAARLGKQVVNVPADLKLQTITVVIKFKSPFSQTPSSILIDFEQKGIVTGKVTSVDNTGFIVEVTRVVDTTVAQDLTMQWAVIPKTTTP